MEKPDGINQLLQSKTSPKVVTPDKFHRAEVNESERIEWYVFLEHQESHVIMIIMINLFRCRFYFQVLELISIHYKFQTATVLRCIKIKDLDIP